MIKNLAKLKYWEIVALGISTAVVSVLLLMMATRALVGTWPQTNEASYIAYVIISAALIWGIVGVAAEAVLHKERQGRIDLQLEEALDTISDLHASFKYEPAPEFNGSHVDTTPGAGRHRQSEPIDLDELAKELGLAPKEEADRG